MRFPLPVSRSNLWVGKSHWSVDPMFMGQMKDLLSRASLIDAYGPAQIYWNGASVATTASMRFPLPVSRSNLWVGKSAWSTDPMFTGQMKDLLVWDVALSPAQLDGVRLG
ncbi:hypothetical protein Ctob_016051, partial [Chrysochromulina tobinii]